MAHYQFTSQPAAPAPPPPEMQRIFVAFSQNAEAASQLFGVIAQTVPEKEFFDPSNRAGILGGNASPGPDVRSAAWPTAFPACL
jgi:hypothetical protein